MGAMAPLFFNAMTSIAVAEMTKPGMPKIPEMKAAPPVPGADAKGRMSAERAMLAKFAKGGRAGTMLSCDEDKLG